MKTGYGLKNRQGGAVAVMVGISMVLLVGFLAMVIDLGHLYIAKTGLQNAADAAALSGARQLNGSANGTLVNGVLVGGICCDPDSAVYKAIDAAGRNTFFANIGQEAVLIGSANESNSYISLSNTPNGPWVDITTAKATPGDKYYIKVDTANVNLTTWFAPIWNIFTTSTYGSAVAGPLMSNIAPIGLCALSTDKDEWVQYDAGGDSYKAEYGYMRGVNYNFGVINSTLSGLGPGTELYLHPMASEESCIQSQGNADFAPPFLCTGRSLISGAVSSVVYTNTGMATGKSLGALNTRFDQYGPPLPTSLDSTVCPPDTNVQEYLPTVANNWMNPQPRQDSAYLLDDWLASAASSVRAPLSSSVRDANLNGGGCNGNCNDNYGVLWSYNRPAVSGVAAASSVSEVWSQLYPSGVSSVPGPTYKPSSAVWGDWTAPYAASSVPYFKAPTPTHTGVAGRRVLNVVLVQCPAAGGGICRPMTILGVGRFFMQRTATNADGITGEFAGLVPESVLKKEIRLFH